MLSLVSMTPPETHTLTLIAGAALNATSPTASIPKPTTDIETALRVASREVAAPSAKKWIIPAAIAAAVALVLVPIMVFVLPGEETKIEHKTIITDKLEIDAENFYQVLLDARKGGRYQEVLAKIDEKGREFSDTKFAGKIQRLQSEVVVQLRQDEDRRKREQERQEAALRQEREYRAALKAAADAEKAGNSAQAMRNIRMAMGIRSDAELDQRLKVLQRRVNFEAALQEGSRLEKMNQLSTAKRQYSEALAFATATERVAVQERISRLEKRIQVEDAVDRAQKALAAKKWREAWDLAQKAKKDGITDERLDKVADRAADELAPKKWLEGPLGIDFIYVPSGSFIMGNPSGHSDEKPAHRVTLSSYYMSRCEVTKSQFEAFQRGLRTAPRARSSQAREPVVSVTWRDAVEFCRYLTSVGGGRVAFRLPTEAEWEFAARGSEGRTYPWGNKKPGSAHANLKGSRDGYEKLAPVGSFPSGATPLGIMDLAGNAAEWCGDYAGAYPSTPRTDPTGPMTGTLRVVRGGSFFGDATWAVATARACRKADSGAYLIGFRVVRDLSEDERAFEKMAKKD
jgi:formylglycine-generating enzyme required for sulfatase activity